MRTRVVGWVLLGFVLLASFGDSAVYGMFAGLLWLVGGISLARLSRDRIAEAMEAVRDSTLARMSLLLTGVLVVAATHLFALEGGVLFLTVVATIGAVSLLVRGAGPTFETLAGIATIGVTFLVVAGVGEFIVRRPSVAAVWGSMAEQSKWEGERYDRFATDGNIFGFRSPYEEIAKPTDTFRIVVIGDSFTWGDKVARTEDLWTARLESLLESGRTGTNVEVVNLGKKGYSTLNEVEVMERLVCQLDPVLVLIQFYANDVYPGGPNFATTDPNSIWGYYTLLPFRFRNGAAARSELRAFLESRLNRVLVDADHPSLYRDDYEGWVQLEGALQTLGSEARRRMVPVAMIMNPHFVPGHWTAQTHPYREVYAKVREAARGAGLQVLDLTSTYADLGRSGEYWWATPYDAHPSVEAHSVIAEATAEFLRTADLVH